MNAVLSTPAPKLRTGETLRVLVAEDDAATRRLLRQHLYRAGIEVLAAASGEEAIEICEREQAPIHLLLTDGIMPGIDGFELARHVARRDPPMRAILLSGFLDHFMARTDIPENMEAFLAKPFVPQELIARIMDAVSVTA